MVTGHFLANSAPLRATCSRGLEEGEETAHSGKEDAWGSLGNGSVGRRVGSAGAGRDGSGRTDSQLGSATRCAALTRR